MCVEMPSFRLSWHLQFGGVFFPSNRSPLSCKGRDGGVYICCGHDALNPAVVFDGQYHPLPIQLNGGTSVTAPVVASWCVVLEIKTAVEEVIKLLLTTCKMPNLSVNKALVSNRRPCDNTAVQLSPFTRKCPLKDLLARWPGIYIALTIYIYCTQTSVPPPQRAYNLKSLPLIDTHTYYGQIRSQLSYQLVLRV